MAQLLLELDTDTGDVSARSIAAAGVDVAYLDVIQTFTAAQTFSADMTAEGAVRFDDRTFSIGGIDYEFPADNGDADDALTTDGSGNLSWEAAGGGAAAAGTLTGTTMASNVVTSSLTAVGTIATGDWQGTGVGVAYGGTGASTLTANGILVGNGTSAVAVTATMATKGHLMVGDGSGVPSMLAVGGTNDHVLTVDSSEATGMKWAAGGGSSDYEGGAVFNDDAADVDFRVESESNPNMLVIDGGNDHMGLGAVTHADTALMVDFPTYVGTAGEQCRYMYIQPAITEAGSGTHGHFSGVEIAPLHITAGAGDVSNACTLRVEGVPTGQAPTGLNLTMWIAGGESLFQGTINIHSTTDYGTTAGNGLLKFGGGTAPAGTNSGNAAFFVVSGEMKVIDQNGTITQLSPHVDGEWVFDSKDSITGKVLRVHMERLMRRLDEEFGGGFIEEYIED